MLRNGENIIDLDGDGIQDKIFVAWRDNANAHGYEQITFYRNTKRREHPWELVPFFDQQGNFEDDAQQTKLGADCTLKTVVVMVANTKAANVTILVANREFGKSYADKAHVSFSYYV